MSSTKDISLMIAALCLLVAGGCKKDSSTTGSLYLHLPTYVGTNPVDSLNKFYADQYGRPMSLSIAQFYISDISLKNAAGTWYTVPNSYILKLWDKSDYVIPNVPVGNYTGIRFNAGIDVATDTTTPYVHSTTGADSVLSTSEIFMWFGWQWQGYIYMYLQGNMDISSLHNGSKVIPFIYIVGGNSGANLKTITLPDQAISVKMGQTHAVNVICDYGKLLEGFNLSDATNRATDTYFTNTTTATVLADSIPNMFRYE
jgi:hypothetical protein